MKIMHIGKYYPPYLGGMETVLRNITEGLLDGGWDVTVLTAGEDSLGRSETLAGPATGREGRLVRTAVHGHFNSQPLTLNLAAAIRRELARSYPDLVHLHLPNPLAAAAWLLLSLGGSIGLPPLAIWYHADITRQRLGRLLVRPVVDRCLEKAAGISVSSVTLKDRSPVLDRFCDRTTVIPFGIDPSPWTDQEATLDGPFLFVGRLVPYKGLDVLIDAMSLVPEAELVIIGEGPLAGELAARAERAGCSGRIEFVGPMDQEQVVRYMARARALLLPSVDASETFGLVQLEAMATGVPVVATNLPTGVREVGAPGQTCLLVPPGDAAALADGLSGLWTDRDRAVGMGRAGRRRFIELFTRTAMVERLEAWYQTLIAAGPEEAS